MAILQKLKNLYLIIYENLCKNDSKQMIEDKHIFAVSSLIMQLHKVYFLLLTYLKTIINAYCKTLTSNFRFIAGLPLILLSLLLVVKCGTKNIRNNILESSNLQSIHISPTIQSGVVHWKAFLNWRTPMNGRIRITEVSRRELILDSDASNQIIIGNQVADNSLLFTNPDNASSVLWEIELNHNNNTVEVFKIKSNISAELKTSIHKYIKYQ